MSKVTVEAGVCGFVTEIEALLNDNQQVILNIDSQCPKITALAEDYNLSEGMTEAFKAYSLPNSISNYESN